MDHFLSGVVAGGVGGLMLGKLYGQSLARALRAWRDLRATQKAISGLFHKSLNEWKHMAKVALIIAAVIAAATWWVIANA